MLGRTHSFTDWGHLHLLTSAT
uniref:Uncharacterized protein n=1 Tax=Arundo donax TaxID=35708 RepID=A0A0A9AD16_ARUDO